MKKHTFGALCALSAAVVQAETAQTDQLAPVVVTATRNATPLNHIPASVTVISPEEIAQAQANDVAELLRGVVGIDLGRNGGPGQNTSVFMRGTESDHTLIMIDGVAINPGTLGNAALQNIDPRLIQRIEIVRGPLSSLYGSAAIGGVINIITRTDATVGSRSHFAAQAGTYNSLSFNAGSRMRKGPASLSLDLSHQSSDGFAARAGDTFDSRFNNDSINANFDYRFGVHTLQLQTLAATGNTGYSLFGSPVDQDFENSVIRTGLHSRINSRWESRLTLSRMTDFIDQVQANYLGDFDYAHTTRYGLDWQNNYRLSAKNLLVAGVSAEHEDITALSYGTSFDVRHDNQALYLQNQYQSGAHDGTAALRLSNYDSFGSHLTWNLGYGYNLSDATRLRTSIGTAFRAPSATDLYGYGGNPALDPEESRSVEIGINHKLSSRSNIDISAYHTRITNLIVTNYYDLDGIDQWGDGNLLDDPRNESVDRASISGIELGYKYTQQPWQFSVNGEWKRPRDDSHDVWLARRARVAAKASLLYSRSDWDTSLDVQYQGRRKDSFWNSTVLDAYTLVNATARWYTASNLTVEARLENLFDTDYQLAGGYNTPGRSIYLGVRVESN